MQPYLDSLRHLRKHFGADAQAKRVIEREIQSVEDWIADHQDEQTRPERRKLGKLEQAKVLPHSRSIFDDVDA